MRGTKNLNFQNSTVGKNLAPDDFSISIPQIKTQTKQRTYLIQ